MRFEIPGSFPDFGGMCSTSMLALLSPFHLPQLLKILCFDPLFPSIVLYSLHLYVRVQVRICVPSPLESHWCGAWEREEEGCSSAFLQSFDPHPQPTSVFLFPIASTKLHVPVFVRLGEFLFSLQFKWCSLFVCLFVLLSVCASCDVVGS